MIARNICSSAVFVSPNSVSFIHTNSCAFSYKYVLVFYIILKALKHFRKHSNMFRSSMRSSSGSFLFISLLMLLILNISNVNKEINKKLPEDDVIEDRNMLECFLKRFKCF